MIELLRTRRSIRKYQDKSIDVQSRNIIEEALLRCPSSRSINHREFYFIESRALLAGLAQAREHGSQFIADAALGIVVCGDEAKCDVWIEDCALAAIVAQLTAHSLGLGCCWIQIRNRIHTGAMTAEAYVQELLNIPQNLKVLCIISIGVPGEAKNGKPAGELDYSKIRPAR